NAAKDYGDTYVFDQTSPSTDFTVTGLKNSDSVSSITLSSSGAGAGATVAGSPYTITPSAAAGTGLGNYDITFADGTLDITPAPLTVTADANPLTVAVDHFTKIYGAANPGFTVRYSGFVLGQGPADLGGTLSFTTPATTGTGVGAYSVTPGGLTAG